VRQADAVEAWRFGPFLGCTGYPECRNIRKIAKSVWQRRRQCFDEKCPVDGLSW